MSSKFRRAIEIYKNDGVVPLAQKSTSFIYRSLYLYLSIILKTILSPIVRHIGEVIPNNETLVLFTTRPGRLYEDNSRYLYEYILENNAELDPVWLTHEKGVYRDLTEQSLPVAYVYSLSGLWMLWRASVGVTTHGIYSFSFDSRAVPDTISIVNVGHGDPVKGTSLTPEIIKKYRKRLREVDSNVRTSEFSARFRLDQYVYEDQGLECAPNWIKDTFIVTGYPRTDLLLDPPEEFTDKWEAFLSGLEPDKVLLYAPTKHYGINVEEGDPAVDFFPFDDFERQELYDLLESKQILVLLRPHPSNVRHMRNHQSGSYKVLREELSELCEQCEYTRMATQYEIADTTELLPFVDILVTDYSSIYHDFLLLDRPILFIPYDYEAFKAERRFRYDYYEHLPGPEISSFTEFRSVLIDILAGKDQHQQKREELRDKIHEFQDGRSRERLTEHILELCSKESK